ncbi:MAG: hypothetical protein MJZ61_01135 [Bacteroidales bacterium]|nr:hypothetical protein [Bacteroidales bacterium]
MYIDNTPSTMKWTLTETITFAASIALMLYAYFHKSDYAACFTIGGLGLIAHIIIAYINPSYIYFNDEDGKKILLRTCTCYPLFRTYREYPFPKSSVVSYKIDESFFGLKKVMTITVTGLDPDTKRPKDFAIENINISTLSKETIAGLKRALNQYVN